MLNENIIAVMALLAASIAVVLGVDNGDLLKLCVAAYLGFLVKDRLEKR